MGELLDFVRSASEKLGIPPEILTGLPVVELTGDAAVLIEQHHGISAYSEEEVCVKVNLGTICVTGSGLTIRLGGAIDGMEVLGVTFAKGLGLTVGSFVMIYNVILYLFIGIIFNSWILPLYSIITYFVGNKTIDFIVEGLDKAKSVMIVTMREEEICQALSDEFGRGITQINARGYFSGAEKCVIYFVVNRFQIPKVKHLVTTIDPAAFITVTEISDVMGTSVKQK